MFPIIEHDTGCDTLDYFLRRRYCNSIKRLLKGAIVTSYTNYIGIFLETEVVYMYVIHINALSNVDVQRTITLNTCKYSR